MEISRSNRLLYRALAALGIIGGLVVLYISVSGAARFPQQETLVRVSGTVEWTHPDEYGIKFRLAGDPRVFSYARKSGELSTVAAALQSSASQPVTVGVLEQPQGHASEPFFQVYEFADARRAMRSLAEVKAAWSTDYKFGYVAALLVFLAAGVLEFVVRRSQPNNSFKPNPLRGSA
jgi:hypothetical protein